MAYLLNRWGPMFRIELGIPREEMLDLSVPEMVDLIDYYREAQRNG